MKNLKNLLFTLPFLFVMHHISGQQLLTHDFEDGTLGPYEVNKSDQRSRVYVRDGALETRWTQDNYDGTNSGRKAQFRPIGWDPNNWQDGFYFQTELWMGFKLKIHDDYMSENTNADACLMQIWGNQGSNLGNHYAMLKVDGRNGGELTWYNRWCCGSASKGQWLVYSDFPREEFVDIIIHVNLSSNGGAVRIWADGELKLSTSNQRMGWGEMNANGMINDSYSTLSMGQYNYRENPSTEDTYYSNSHLFNGHLEGETRTVTYDNVSLYNGANGYDLVNPADGNEVEVCGGFEATSIIEAEDFCNQSGIQTEASDEGTDNVGWIENGDWLSFNDIDLSGIQSIDARVASNSNGGTIEVRTGSSTGPLIGTVAVGNTGGFQAWETQSGSINSTEETQDVYLVFTGGTGYLFNLNHIQFSTEETLSIDGNLLLSGAKVYPNPVVDQLHITNIEASELKICNSLGMVKSTIRLENDAYDIDMSDYPSGIYFLLFSKKDSTIIKKIIVE